MEKYISADHQNLDVWCRRAGIELVDVEKRLAVLALHFGTGRRAVLRMIGVRLVKLNREHLDYKVGWVVGKAIGDLVYTRAYTYEVVKNQTVWLANYLVEQCEGDVNQMAAIMLNAEFICEQAARLMAARQNERNARHARTSGGGLANMIIRKVRGH